MSKYVLSHSGEELDKAIDKVLSGYVLPSGEINIRTNGEYDVTEFTKAVVNVPVNEGYINPADVITHISKNPVPATGTYVSSGADMSNISVAVGFKPKIFLFLHRGTMGNNTVTRKLICSLMLCDDNYEIIQMRSEWMSKESSSSSRAVGGQTSAVGFTPTENGVKGVGTMLTSDSGNEYAWMAWG